VTDEERRLLHAAAEDRNRQAMVPAPSPGPQPESHVEAMATAHGCTPPSPGVTPASGEGHGVWPRPSI
jgi:hypothetical protein